MERRAAGALLALAACFACSAAAPTATNQTSLDLYEGAPEGCYYNFQHYGEGDRIMTNEPCLNCTCHNRMLMCYLRVCPFTKAIGQDCTVEKRADQCCPIVTCPDVPVDLLTSTSTTSPAEYGATGLGKLDKYGCSINNKYFPEGSKVPPTPNKPCEHCYCIRNMTTCVMQECTLHVDGCTPIYHKDVCCPVRYSCDHLEDEMPLLDDMSTTVRPTPGFLLTTTTVSPVTQMTQDCVHDDQIFADGALIKTEKACEHCYCMKGDIVCVVQECGAPMENEGKNCTSLPPREGQCCPDTYICEGDELSSEMPTDVTTESVMEMITTLVPPRRGGVEGSGYRNEPDEALYTAIPTIESEIEGSGDDHDTSKPEEGLETIPPTEDGEQFISVTKAPIHDEREHSTTESDKKAEAQTLEPVVNVATTISPIEKVTDEMTAELKPYEHYTTTSTEKIATEYGEFLNTVPDEVPEVDDTKTHAETTTSESIIEGSGSPLPTENEDGKTTVTSEKEEAVTIAASEYNTPTVSPETMTEKELFEADKDISRTTVAKVEEYTEKIERESSTPESFTPSSTNVPVEDAKLTTEPDHAQNTVAVAEEEITDSHIPKVTSVPDSFVEVEKTTVPYVEQELTTEKTVKDEVSRPSELVPTATTALGENELSTEEPDKGLNTIPNEVNEESTSAVPHLIDTKTPEPATQDADMKQTTILETGTLTPEIIVTKGDQHTFTTEPSFRKEDELSVSTKKPIDFVSTTVRPEFVDEGLIPTSTHDERIGSSSEVPSMEEDMTTLIPEYTKDLAEADVSKQTTPESISDVSVVTTIPVKHPEPSVDHEGETLSSTEKSTETTAFIVEDVATHEEPSRIPGEGDCLLNGVTYRNNSVVPSTNNCHTGCRCASSIIKCDPIICSPPPDYMANCQSIYDSPDSCCPTYVCDHPRETVPPQSDNQMSGTESPLSSPTIECRGDQCEIGEPVKQSTDRSEPCTGDSCSGGADHKSELPHTTATCENEEDCKSVDINAQEATPCEGDSCKKIDCAGDNCYPDAIFAPDHTPKTPQDIPMPDCSGEEPCRRKETEDTSAKIPAECDGPNCISETEITAQDVVYASTKSSIPTEEVTEKIEVALGEITTAVPESPTKDKQDLDSYTTEKQLGTMTPSKEEPEVNGDVETKKPMSVDGEVTEKSEFLDDADKENPINTKDSITERPTMIDKDVKVNPTDADEEVTYKPALTDDEVKKETSALVDEITETPTVTDDDNKAKPTVIVGDVTEKPALTDEDGKQKPADTQETVTDIPAFTDDGGKGLSTEIEEEITEKPSLIDDDGKVKPPVIDEDITEKPVDIDEEVKGKPTDVNEEVTEKPSLTDDDGKIKPTVIDEEVTKKPALSGDDDKETSTDIAEPFTNKPTLTDEDGKVTSVSMEEITEKPTIADEDDKHKPAVTDEDVTGKPDLIDEYGKAKPTIIDEDVTGVTGKPDITDEDGKIKPTIIDEDVTDKPDSTDDDGRRKPSDTEDKITDEPTLTDKHDEVQPIVIDEDVTGKPDLIDEDGKFKPTIIDEDVTGKPDLIVEDGKVKPTDIDEDVTGKPDFIDEEGKIKPTVIDEDVTEKPDLIDEDGKAKPTDIDENVTGKPDFIDEDGKAKPTVIDEYVTKKPDLIDEDGKAKPTVIDEDVTHKSDLIDEDGKAKPTVIEEDVTNKPDLIDEDGKAKPTVIDESVPDKPGLIDEDGKAKPSVIDEDVTGKPDLTDDDGKGKPTVVDENVTDKPDDDGRRKPTDTEEKITEKPSFTDEHDKVQPTVIDDQVTPSHKPVPVEEDGKEKPTDTDEETTQKPILIDEDKQTSAIQEEVTEKSVVYDDDGKGTSAMQEEITEQPALTGEDGKIKPTFIDEDVTGKPADTQEKVTEIPALIDNDGKGSSTEIEEEVTEKPALTDDDDKIKSSVIDQDITEKPIQIDEDAKYKPTDDVDEKETEKPVLIVDDGKETSSAMEDIITEKPATTDIDVKETYTAIQEEVTEKSTLTDDAVKEKPTETYEEMTDKPSLTDEDSKVKPTVSEEEITKKPASIDDEGKVKPSDERVTDESISEVTNTPPSVTEEASGTQLPEIERTKPETETPEILVHPTDSSTSELQDVTKTPYHESTTTLTAEDVHAFSTESNIEPVDVTTSVPKEIVPSKSPEIGETEYVTKMPTKSQPEQEVTTVGTYETAPNVAITSDQEIQKETYDTTSPKQDIEEKPSTQASKLHDESESNEMTTKPTIGEQEETSTDIPDLESLVTRKQEGGPVEIEPQEGPAGDKHKQPESGSIDDEMTTKMYDDGKIKPVPESHVTEQAMAVTPAYDSISEQPVEASEQPEMQDDKKKTPEIPDSDKTKDESYITEKDKTVTETPASSVDVSTEQQIPLETQKVGDEGTTIKSYLPESGSTELPDKAIGEDLEHSTQASEFKKEKPGILPDATEEPISVVTESQEMFPTSEKDVISYGEKTTSVPDEIDQIHKGTTPVEEYTQEVLQQHVTTEEAHSKAPDTYITDEYVTEIPESSTKSDGLKEVGSETIPTDIPRTSEKAQETTEPGLMYTESHDHEIKEPSVTEIQEQSTRLPITSEGLETERPEVQVTSETPQSLVTGHSETTTSIFKEESQEPELVTIQVQETTKAPELPVFVTEQEELQTKAPVSMTEPVEHDVKETATKMTEDIGKVTKVPEEAVTEKQETATTLRESSSPGQEEPTEKPQVDIKPHETTESQSETSETTTDLIILEEHTHKIAEDTTTELPTENEISDVTGDISTLPPYEEHTSKVPEHIPSESPIDEKRTTSHDGTEHQYSELTTEKTPEKEIEVATKETDTEMKPSEETPIEGVTDKIQDTVVIEETTAATVQDIDSKYTIAHKEYTTSAPTQVSEETTPEAITEPALVPVSEIGLTGSSTKEPTVTEKPTHKTTVPEDELIFSTTKATTVRQGEESSDDKVAKPEDRPIETSEVPPTSTTAEVQKPIITDTQPTEKIPEPEEEFPSMGPNGYGEPDYVEEDQAFGPGTCRYGGKVYVSAQQIPRDDPCDFCFCFRSDIICLQQSCPPPIHGCHEEPIQGFCCPRYECPVSMATTVNVTTTTTTTTTTLPPHFPTHSYKGAAQRRGCQIKGHTYKVGEVVRSSSGPCLHCTCGGDGQMKCDPKACTPEPMLRQMIAAAVSAKRRR